jgi:hypothetical protein
MAENSAAPATGKMAEAVEAALALAKAAAAEFELCVQMDVKQLGSKDTQRIQRAMFAYFDQTMAWRSVHNFKSIDAAIAHWYKVDDGDVEMLKIMRDRVTYQRRQGAKFAGRAIGNQGGGTAAVTDGDGKAAKASNSPFAKVSQYLKKNWSTLSLAEQASLLRQYQALYQKAKAEAEAVAKAEAHKARIAAGIQTGQSKVA